MQILNAQIANQFTWGLVHHHLNLDLSHHRTTLTPKPQPNASCRPAFDDMPTPRINGGGAPIPGKTSVATTRES